MVRESTDAIATRLGLPTQALAVLLIVLGILVLVLPRLLPWIVGLGLVAWGVLALLMAEDGLSWRPARRRSEEPPRV